MDLTLERDPRVLWSFWVSAAIALTAGLAPLLLGAGGPNRMAGAVIPFTVAAAAMAVNALLYRQGKPLAAALYFIAGVAIVYGLLMMLAVSFRLAVVGTCDPAPAVCGPGLERPLSSGESTALMAAVVLGGVSILAGFYGLLVLYRRRPKPPASS